MDIYTDGNSGVKNIVPLKKEQFRALSGRSKRRLERQQTIRLDGYCPACGSRCRWKKVVPTGGYTNGKPDHVYGKWVCQNAACGKTWDRKDFDYVKYQRL